MEERKEGKRRKAREREVEMWGRERKEVGGEGTGSSNGKKVIY